MDDTESKIAALEQWQVQTNVRVDSLFEMARLDAEIEQINATLEAGVGRRLNRIERNIWLLLGTLLLSILLGALGCGGDPGSVDTKPAPVSGDAGYYVDSDDVEYNLSYHYMPLVSARSECLDLCICLDPALGVHCMCPCRGGI